MGTVIKLDNRYYYTGGSTYHTDPECLLLKAAREKEQVVKVLTQTDLDAMNRYGKPLRRCKRCQ